MEDAEKHAQDIGRIVGQLQSIEFLLRWWLAKRNGHEIVLPSHVGQVLNVTPVTDYRTMGQLIKAYNSQLNAEEANYQLDMKIVEIRDALAHGRVLAIGDEAFLTLYRFSKPTNGQVETTAITSLSNEALAADIDMLQAEFVRLLECGSKRDYFH